MTEPFPEARARASLSSAGGASSASTAPVLPPRVPTRGSALGRFIGRTGLSLAGWRLEGNFPDLHKLVVIVAPHTSNWDFIVGFWCYLALDLDATWFGKHTLFRWPFGAVLRHFGGIPILREARAAANIVDLYVAEFAKRERMVLAIAPEGTRKKVPDWKTGFYRIAHQAGVPIVPVALDFSRKRVTIGAPFTPTGDLESEVMQLKALFEPRMARYPSQF